MSIIHFELLEGENFGSWKSIYYEFPQNGKQLIIGKNGAGKSTFFEMPSWILYGKNTKDLKVDDVINWHLPGGCWGKLTFTKGDKRYRVERYRGHKEESNNVKLFEIIDGKDKDLTKTANLQDEIEKIIGLNHTAFICSILLSQSKMSTFLEIKGADRHELFDSIMQLQLLKPYETKIRNRYNHIKKELLRLDKETYSLQEKLTQLEGIISDYQSNVDQKKKKLQTERDEYQSQFDNIQKIPIKSLKEYYNLSSQFEEKEAEISNEHEVIDDEIADKQEKVEHLKKSKCPECGQKVDAAESLKKYQEEIADLEEEKQQILEQNKECEKELQKIGKAIDKMFKSDLKDFVKNDQVTVSYEDIIRYEAQIETLKTKIELVDKNIKDAGTQTELDKLNKIYKENKSVLEKQQKEAEVLSEEKRRFNDFWVRAFDKKDELYIKKILMSSLIAQTNNYINRRISQFNFDEVQEAWFTDELDFIVNITQEKVNKDVPYKALSGGEKRKLNVCVNLALNDLIYLQYARIAETFLDEISTGLDDESNIVLAKMIDELAQEKPVHVISHANIFNNQFDEVIRVERHKEGKNKFSKFEKVS